MWLRPLVESEGAARLAMASEVVFVLAPRPVVAAERGRTRYPRGDPGALRAPRWPAMAVAPRAPAIPRGRKCGTLRGVMIRRWLSVPSMVRVSWGGVVFALACSQPPEPADPTIYPAPPGEAEMAPPAELVANEPSANDGPASDPSTSAGADPVTEPTVAEAPPAEAGSSEASSDSSGERMVEFFEVGRGDRIADLGVSGYSLSPVRRALGPTGLVYVRRRTPPPQESLAPTTANDLAPLVWMNTPDDAPLSGDATKLNAVTVLFSYSAVSPGARKSFNAAVYKAIVPGGLYIIAGYQASSDSKPGTARQPTAVTDSAVRADVEGAGFQFVEAADFVSSAASAADVAPSRYVLKFRKPK